MTETYNNNQNTQNNWLDTKANNIINNQSKSPVSSIRDVKSKCAESKKSSKSKYFI